MNNDAEIEAKTGATRFISPTHLICLALALLTFTVYWPVLDYDFVNYDDPGYVTENKVVQKGLTAETAPWALTTSEMSNWHPLTWISYLLDWQIHGNDAGGFHLTNLLFHTANAVLLFLLMQQMTGARWKSFMVAAIFALHPLHIESVAWISERKDVLSAFFAFLTIMAYVRFVRTNSKFSYGVALIFFALGLMSKPMLVTLPCLLLLLDSWPLQRVFLDGSRIFSKTSLTRYLHLVVEKTPFFIVTILACIVTYVAQDRGGSVSSLEKIPIGWRISNAFISCIVYLKQTIWPVDLAIFYPYQKSEIFIAVLSGILVAGISVWTLIQWRRKPVYAVGWFWFFGMLIPVLGIVQVGAQAHADRYTYLPMIGISIFVIWGLSEWVHRWAWQKHLLAGLSAIGLGACFLLSRNQIPTWQNSETLWRHALAVTKDNDTAYHNLGGFLVSQGKYDEAFPLFQKAVEIYPRYALPHEILGQLLARKGQLEEAQAHYLLAIQYKTNFASAHKNLGILFSQMGKPKDAAAEYERALAINPDFFEAHYNLAVILFSEDKTDEAIQHYTAAVRLKPEMWQAHVSLGVLFAEKENWSQAKNHFQLALRLNPDYPEAHFFLGEILSRGGETEAAREHFLTAVQLRPDYADAARALQELRNKSD